MYTYQGRQYPVNIVMYITYTYPEVQPKILVQPNPGTQIRPDGRYLSPVGVMAPFPGWTQNCNFSTVV